MFDEKCLPEVPAPTVERRRITSIQTKLQAYSTWQKVLREKELLNPSRD